MLKDRIRMTSDGFQILKEADSDRSASFGVYTLAEDPNTVPDSLTPAAYWDPLYAPEQKIKGSYACVYVREEAAGNVVEETRFIWIKGDKKLHLTIDVSENRKYGNNAYMITITWDNSEGEKINHKYIFLRSKKTGDKFYFLNRCIQPLEDSKEVEDKYVFVVPEGDDPEEYFVDVLPELLMRYDIERE